MPEAIRAITFPARTSEMFGTVQAVPQVETTPFYPLNPYGAASIRRNQKRISF
ncbi:MAG: hypothetical protein FD176_63 [Rhodospirillaceae bacterium]|nr:MAG: hypothetical protein FD176_63 [Rhodospirillaceae bacterium]TNC94847.1 MAG: hypothetical protein FD119_2896 [Stygiobacter sp.]